MILSTYSPRITTKFFELITNIFINADPPNSNWIFLQETLMKLVADEYKHLKMVPTYLDLFFSLNLNTISGIKIN